MTYRGRIPNRRENQMGNLYAQAGYTATWRAYASAVTGNSDLGMGDTLYYTETVITALLGNASTPSMMERQQAVGLTVAADIYAVTREALGRRDELVWRGVTFRVDSDPVPGQMAGGYVTHLKRGE